MNSRPPERVVFVGLDGATFSVLEPLIQDGIMPYLGGFLKQGVHGVLLSTPHPLTPPAWTSLATGQPPGQHGVFDFVRVEWGGEHPTYTLGTSADVCCETVWSIASRQGKRVMALNFPYMFPAPQINGFVVPGFVPWQYLSRAVYPPGLYKRLEARPGFNARVLALDWDIERKALQGLPEEDYEDWVQFHIDREKQLFDVTCMLMREDPCDLTAVLFDAVDKIQHLCYHLLDPRLAAPVATEPMQRTRALCLEYFRQLDGFIARIAEMAGSEARLFIASDHGFTAAGERIFYANVWLEQHGYLGWADGIPLDQEGRLTLAGHGGSDTLFDWNRTTAFALTASSNAIHIRRAKRPGQPGISDEQYPEFRARLIASLLAYTDPQSDQPVIERVLTREEAFPGEYRERAPDLTLVLKDHSFLSVLRADAALKTRSAPYGTHHPHGIFAARGPHIPEGVVLPPFSIVDIAPTLLYSLGLPVPNEMEGRPNRTAFEPGFVASHPVKFEGPSLPVEDQAPEREEPSPASAEEEAEILKQTMLHLHALGYIHYVEGAPVSLGSEKE